MCFTDFFMTVYKVGFDHGIYGSRKNEKKDL